MVDDMKKHMRRFEHLVGFKGRLDVTSRESMKRLIDALDCRYKDDIQNSIRLHRLEFFHDLVEGGRKRKEKTDKKAEAPAKKRKRKKSDEKEEEEDKKEEVPEGPTETDQTEAEDVLSVRATDVDDWKDLMTLSKIYYVLEHPRSEGLKWKRRIVKKKKIQKFTDKDFIEWRVTQNFRLRGLEEWAQRRSDARKLAEQQHFDMEEIESDDDAKELEQLYEMFDPSGRKYKSKQRAGKPKKVLSTADRPFKFKDESIEDWTESYSDDSDFTDEDFVEETDDFEEEKSKRKIPESEDEIETAFEEEEEDIAEMFSKYRQFTRYREEIFKRMEKAETTEEWFKLYFESCPTLDELEITGKEIPLITVAEEEEESEPERDEKGEKVEKMDKLEETGEKTEIESKIKEKDLIKEDLKQYETDIALEEKESQLESVVKYVIQTVVKETIEPREQFEKEMGTAEEEMDTEVKSISERMIPIPEEETSGLKGLLESPKAVETEKKPGVKYISGEMIHFLEKGTREEREKLKAEMGIVEEDLDSEIKSVIEEVIPIQEEETVGEEKQLESITSIVEIEKHTEPKSITEEVISIQEEETIVDEKQLESKTGTVEKEKHTEPKSGAVGVIPIQEEETIVEEKQLESLTGIVEKEKHTEPKPVTEEVIQNLEDVTIRETNQSEFQKGTAEEEIKPEDIAKETIQKLEKTIELDEQTNVENESVKRNEPLLESTDDKVSQKPREIKQEIDSETEGIEDDKEPKAGPPAEDGSEPIEEERMEKHKDIEKNDGAADDKRTESTLKELDQTQEIENTVNKKEVSLVQDPTLSSKEQSDGLGMQKSVDEVNETTDTDKKPMTEMSELEAKELSTKNGKQEKNGNKLDAVKKGGIEEVIKNCSSKRQCKSRKSVKYSLTSMDDESSPQPFYVVRRSGSQERVLLCAACSRSITDIPSQDTDEDESSYSETDSTAEEDERGQERD